MAEIKAGETIPEGVTRVTDTEGDPWEYREASDTWGWAYRGSDESMYASYSERKLLEKFGPVTYEEPKVTLELTQEQATALSSVLGMVGGRHDTRRGRISEVVGQLWAAGVRHEVFDRGRSGGITFTS